MNKEEFKQISEDDFYRLQPTFSIWLIKKRKKYFDDLSTKKQKSYFKKFVKKYNKQKLSEIFYKPAQLLEKYKGLLNSQSWNLNNKDVENNLKYMTNEEMNFTEKDLFSRENEKQGLRGTISSLQMRPSNPDQQYEREIEQEKMQEELKYNRKKFNKQYKEEMEELIPKKVGKEAILDKKRVINQKINGSKDESGFNDYDDDFLMGGDSQSSFKRAKQMEIKREQYRNERKQNQFQSKYHSSTENSRDLLMEKRQKDDRAIQLALQGGKKFV